MPRDSQCRILARGVGRVRETLRFDAEGMNANAKARLEALEKLLRPADLVQTVRSLVLARSGGDSRRTNARRS
jgi:hypothetical protein